MKKPGIILFISLSLAMITSAQKNERDANYHYKSKNFYVAVDLYKTLYQQDTTNHTFIERYAECLVECKSQPQKAIHLFLKLDSVNAELAEYHFYLGMAYHYNKNFKKAIEQFQKAQTLNEKDENLVNNSKLWISYAQSAQQLIKNPLDVSFVNLGDGINSKMDETTPFISSAKDILFYTSNEKFDSKYMLYSSNVYAASEKYGVFSRGKALNAVNSLDDEFMAGISLMDDKLYVQLQGFEGYQDIIFSKKNGRSYRGKILLNDNVNSKSAEIAAFETAGGDTLYFSSNRPGGLGGMDLYYSRKLPDGTWSIPTNLGNTINTAYDEDFPVIASNSKTFYFCSNNPKSMGGFDIYKSMIDPKSREFKTPENLGYPLNDMYDNKTIAFGSENRYAYVSAIRNDGFGYADLYRVVFNQEDPSVKIYKLIFKTKTADETKDFAFSDTTLQITAFNKNKTVFGEYAYDSKNSETTIALPPGFYTLEITGKQTETYNFKVTIADAPSTKKIIKKEIVLTQKK